MGGRLEDNLFGKFGAFEGGLKLVWSLRRILKVVKNCVALRI